MKIAYNPKTAAALTVAPSNNDITFDLPGQSIYVKGVKFDGKAYSIFKKYTSATAGGYNGLVPAPSYNDGSTNRFLKEDGTWGVPEGTGSTIVSSTASGLAPKIGTAAASTVTTQADEWVLTSTKGATPTWRKLPTNAFLNYYRPILVNGTSLLGNDNTALNIVAGNDITLVAEKDTNDKYTGKLVINSSVTNITGNAATATKLQTKRKIWGQDFDGTADVSGSLTGVTSINAVSNQHLEIRTPSGSNKYIYLRYNSSITSSILLTGTYFGPSSNSSGKLSLGTSADKWDHVYAKTFIGNLDWSYITNKPTSFTPAAHDHKRIISSDDSFVGIEPSVLPSKYEKGVTFNTCYSANWPSTYGNLLTLRGRGDSQIFVTWSAAQTATVQDVSNEIYLRSKRDSIAGDVWSNWTRVLTNKNYGSYVAAKAHTHPTSDINLLTGYTKATSASDLVTTDTLNTALGKLEYKAGIAYSWYRTITEDDTDEIINKWDEVVDFVNNLAVDLTEEFVTRKTGQIITGQKNFSTASNSAPLKISREGRDQECLSIGVNDTSVLFNLQQDETTAIYKFTGTWTNTGDGGDGTKPGTAYVQFNLRDNDKNIYLNNGTTTYTVLHSGIAYINNGTITIDGKSITPLTTHQSLANYVTLNTNQIITGSKQFSADIALNHYSTKSTSYSLRMYGTSDTYKYLYAKGNDLYFDVATFKGKIWREDNDGSGSGLDADLLDGKHASQFIGLYTRNDVGTTINFDNPHVNGFFEMRRSNEITSTGIKPFDDFAPILSLKSQHVMMQIAGKNNQGWWIRGIQKNNATLENVEWQQLARTTDNVASATKLQTPRKIWGNDFDGTQDVYQDLMFNHSYKIQWRENTYADAFAIYPEFAGVGDYNKLIIASSVGDKGVEPTLTPKIAILGQSGNVGIGTITPTQKLEVVGNTILNGNVGIGTTDISYPLNVLGSTNLKGKVFVRQDASMAIYSEYNSRYTTDWGKEVVAIQTAFDNQDPITSEYPNDHPTRCVLALQPRGGFIGIGTTSPQYTLDVHGTIRLTDSLSLSNKSAMIKFAKADGTLTNSIQNDVGNLTFDIGYGHRDESAMQLFGTSVALFNGNTRVLTAMNNNVFIGTRTDNNHKLNVDGNVFVSNYINFPNTEKLTGIVINPTDAWIYKIIDTDGTTTKEYKIPHYGHAMGYYKYIHTNGTSETHIGSFISDYFGLNFHVGMAEQTFKFGYGSGDNLVWSTTLYGDGRLITYGEITGKGFKKQNSSDSYVLLGGGGHKAISDFLLKSEIANQELSANLTTITKSLTVTADWMDTGIKHTDLTTGTYIVQLSVSANNSTDALYDCFWSGVLTWFSGKNYTTTNDTEADEILLHRSGHGYHNTIYLRTIMTTSTDGRGLKLQIAANKNIGAAYTYTFKFKRII